MKQSASVTSDTLGCPYYWGVRNMSLNIAMCPKARAVQAEDPAKKNDPSWGTFISSGTDLKFVVAAGNICKS